MDIELIDLNTSNADRTDRAPIAFKLVPEARQTYPAEDDFLGGHHSR